MTPQGHACSTPALLGTTTSTKPLPSARAHRWGCSLFIPPTHSPLSLLNITLRAPLHPVPSCTHTHAHSLPHHRHLLPHSPGRQDAPGRSTTSAHTHTHTHTQSHTHRRTHRHTPTHSRRAHVVCARSPTCLCPSSTRPPRHTWRSTSSRSPPAPWTSSCATV